MPNIQALLKIANEVATRSPDPYKKVGCVGLDSAGNFLCTGFNHAGIEGRRLRALDNLFWQDREARAKFMVHAEIEMIKSVPPGKKLHEVVLTLFPCIPCMITLSQFGVKVIHYVEIYDKDKPALEVARHYGIECNQVEEITDARDKSSSI